MTRKELIGALAAEAGVDNETADRVYEVVSREAGKGGGGAIFTSETGTSLKGYHVAQVFRGGDIVIASEILPGAVPVAICDNKQRLLAALRQVARYAHCRSAGPDGGYDGFVMLAPGVGGASDPEQALAAVEAFSKKVRSRLEILSAPKLAKAELVKALAVTAGVDTESATRLYDAIARRIAGDLTAQYLCKNEQ